MKADDVTDTLELALRASGLEQVEGDHRPRLRSDGESSYISAELASWLQGKGMKRVRGAPYHPRTQGKIERWQQTLENCILLENYVLPADLEAQIEAFVGPYNHRRHHESLDNLTLANVYSGRGAILSEEKGASDRPSKTAACSTKRRLPNLQPKSTRVSLSSESLLSQKL